MNQRIIKSGKTHPLTTPIITVLFHRYHRQKLVEWTEDPAKELSLTAEVLEEDGKNYHSWQHRQWIVQRYGLWDGELDFTDEMIKKDLRNNSAWNQRYFIVSNTTGFTDDVIEKELQ